MAITPTVMIAASGMLNGQGVGVNSSMLSSMTAATSDPLTGGISSLQSKVSSLDPTSAASLTATLGTMPSALTSVNSAAASATSQASSMVPDVKTFISLHSSSTAFGSSSADYGAALQQFGNKSFGDLGIGVSNFADVGSGGLTSLVPGLGNLASQAKSSAFGGIGANLDPTLLAKGQAVMASSALSDGLGQVSTGLKNYGTLVDFSNPQTLGYAGIVRSLQNEGLADSLGVNDEIAANGYDPKNLKTVPDSVLASVLDHIQGNDLQRVLDQFGVKPAGTVMSVADLADPSNVMPAGAVTAMGIAPGAGAAGLQSVGNTLTNIGAPMSGASAASLLGSVQTKVGGYLSGLTELVPKSISSALTPMLGSGTSVFGTPSMKEMMGSVSGVHTGNFTAATAQLSSISGSSQGQSLSSAMQAVLSAITGGSGLTAALAALSAATAAFNSSAAGNPSLSGALSSISGSMSAVTSHISLENSNLSLAGFNLASPPTNPGGSSMILGFASKLHSFGVDTQQLGHNDMFNGVAADNLTGDAIKASLAEGKNVAAMQLAGKAPPQVSDTQAAQADANSANIDTLIQNWQTAKSTALSAKANYQSLKQAQPPADAGTISSAYQAWDSAIDAQSNARQVLFQTAMASNDQSIKDKVAAALGG